LILVVSCGDDDSTDSDPSVPGDEWVIRATGTSNYLMDVAYSGTSERFVTVGQGGVIISSLYGDLWQQAD
jgi:hypothetical protein